MASKSKKKRKLEAVYAEVPDVPCKKLCSNQCTMIPVTDIEMTMIKEASVRNFEFVRVPGNPTLVMSPDPTHPTKCPALVGTRCSIYESRPLICRMYGAAEGLPCSHGCKPDGDLLKKKRAAELVRILMKL